MSGQTSGQGEGGDGAENPPQQLDTSLLEGVNVQGGDGGRSGQATTETVEEDEQDDDNHDLDEIPERPSSRLDYASDEEGNTIMFQPHHQRSTALSRISELSNETTRSAIPPQAADEQPNEQPPTLDVIWDNGPDNSDSDSDQLEENLAEVADARSQLFDGIFTRFRNENLYTDASALMAAEVMGRMPGAYVTNWWNAQDLEARLWSQVQAMNQYNTRPRDDGTKLPSQVQNQIRDQLQAMAYQFRDDAMRWLTQGLRSDTDLMSQMLDSIDDLLANRPRAAPTSRALSMASSTSGPERVGPLLDRQRLRRQDPEVLISMILQQDNERRAAADQFEADIENATEQADAQRDEAVAQRDKAQADLNRLVAGTQQLREIAHENGLNNRDMNGKPLQERQVPAGAMGTRRVSSGYIHDIERQLQESNDTHDKDRETIEHLRAENADLRENLQAAQERADQAREQADEARRTGLNAEGTESGDPFSGQEMPAATSSEVSASRQEAAPSLTSEHSNSRDAADHEPLRDTDAELEALRIEHEHELAQLRADYTKEINDLRSEMDDDRRRAQETHQEGLSIDDEPSTRPEGSVRSQPNERRKSGVNHSATNGAPRLDDLLEALWADDKETAYFMDLGDSSWQGAQRGLVEHDSTGQRSPTTPLQTGSGSNSGVDFNSPTTTDRLAERASTIQELSRENFVLRRRLNTTEQMREGAVARTRHLEAVRNGLQENLAKAFHRQDALRDQISALRQVRTDLQQALEESEETQGQLATELERARNTLQLHLASSPTTRNTDEDDAATAEPTTDALQQRVENLGSAKKTSKDEVATEQAANRDPQQSFANVDQGGADLETAVDNDFVTHQGLQDENANLRLQNTSLNQNLRRTTRERDEAREELVTIGLTLENAQHALQRAEAERDQAILNLKEAESLLEEQTTNLQRAEDEAQTAFKEELGSRKLLADARRQLKDCQAHRTAQGSSSAPDNPQQDPNIVNRLLQVLNRLRRFTPHANEIAQFATVSVETGRRAPAEWAAELRQVTDLADTVRWPDNDFSITPAQREDPGLLAAEVNNWASTIEAAIDDSVRLSAAVGSLRVAIEIWNVLNPREPDGSDGGRPADPASQRGNSQAGPPASRHSIASTTDSFTTQERGELLNAAAEAVNQYMREHPDSPVDDARRLQITGAAADLFLSRLMGEHTRSDKGGEDIQHEEGDNESRTTSNNGVEGSSAGGRRRGSLGYMPPTYIDLAWLRAHRNGPCRECVPVYRFPEALFPGGVDPGPCKCGPANTVSIHTAESRSSFSSGLPPLETSSLGLRSSRTRSVAFSDDHGAGDQDAPGGGSSSKPSRGILKSSGSIDTAKANASNSRAPLTPYPRRAWSLPFRNAARLPFARHTQRSKPGWTSRSGRGMSLPPRQLSHDNAVPIMPVQKHCCEHFDKRKLVCSCKGECKGHWCCEHWDVTGVCKCKGTCHVPCCKHWKQNTKWCGCKSLCAEHTSKKCCPCGFKPGIVPRMCACDNTCRDHAVCEHFRTYKPEELSCMAGCDAFRKNRKCKHGQVCQKTPCDAHPCCAHHVSEDSRAYCGCGKTCGSHVCCSHWLPGFKTCECLGTCQDHLPVIPEALLQHFREVATLAEAQSTPSRMAARLYYPSGRMFPREEDEPYDWHQVVRANMDLLRTRGFVGPNGNILAAPDYREAARARSQATRAALANLATLIAPPAPPGAFQASLRGGSGDPGRSRGVRRRFGLRNDALPDMPEFDTGGFLSDSLLDFPGPRPDFGNDEDEDSTQSTTRTSSRSVAGADAGHGGCGCKCRCQGDEYHVLTGPGGRFAYYSCRGLTYRGNDDGHEDDGVDSTRAAGASSNPTSTAGSSFVSRLSRSEILTRHNSLQNSAAAGSQVGSQQGTQSAGSRRGSQRGSQGFQSRVGSRAGSRQSFHSTASRFEAGQGSRRGSAKSGTASATGPIADDQELNIGDQDEQRPAGGGGGGAPGGPGGNGRPLNPSRPDRQPPANPWRQIWDFSWLLIRFFTYGQVANLRAILSFAYDFTLLNIQQVLHFLHLAQHWQRLPNPRFPHAKTISFMLWALLVWQLTMMIALGEERRLWLAANPRTAAYVRGLQFREPYPRWSLFQVDYALLQPALSGFSVWLHRLYFRPGMFSSLGHATGVVLDALSYSRVEEAVVHAKNVILDAGEAVVMLPVVVMTAVWTFIVRMMPSWLDVSSERPGTTGGAVITAQPPSFSDPQVVHDGATWWEIFWEYFKDLVVRTVTGRRKVSHG